MSMAIPITRSRGLLALPKIDKPVVSVSTQGSVHARSLGFIPSNASSVSISNAITAFKLCPLFFEFLNLCFKSTDTP